MSYQYYNNVTIILQGIINKNVDIFNTLSEYINYGQIIISIYDELEDIDIINNIKKTFPTVTIAHNNLKDNKLELTELNKFTNTPYMDNCYYQIKSTLKALEYVNTEYVVKSRVDHYYKSVDDFIIWGIHQNKIISSSIFVRGVNYAKYHLSDCLFSGKTCEISKMMNLALQNYNPGCPEVNIWKPYILHIAKINNVNLECLDDNSYAEFMAKYFYIYCINRHASYKINYRKIINTYINDRDKTTIDSKEYFLLGCDQP